MNDARWTAESKEFMNDEWINERLKYISERLTGLSMDANEAVRDGLVTERTQMFAGKKDQLVFTGHFSTGFYDACRGCHPMNATSPG